MDQVKIGNFLKELRKEKALTHEELAEKFNVSRRTVTRWETGYNMPDLSLLVEIADFYDVDLRELFNGERNKERMDKELEETVKQACEYSDMNNSKAHKITLIYLVLGVVGLIINQVLSMMDLPETFWIGFAKGVTAGLSLLSIIFAVLYITGKLKNVQDIKRRLFKNKR